MKVVIAHNRYSSAQPSGENSVVDGEIEQLSAAGISVVPFQRSSDDISGLSSVDKARLVTSPINNPDTQRELSALIERERPDVVHLHNPYPLLSPAVIRTAHRHGVGVVHTVHNFRQVCMNGLYFRDGHLCHDCKGKKVGVPGVIHGCYRGSRAQSAIMATTLAVTRPTWKTVDRFIALTGDIKQHLLDYGIEADRITVKPNSIADPGEFQQSGDGFVFIGRLSEEKGIRLLLDAWRLIPEDSVGPLTVVGDGPLAAEVRAVAANRGDLKYEGPVPHSEITRKIRSAACLITTSLCADVLPTVVIEALANSRPVLTTDLGGPPHMIGEAGHVVATEAAAVADGIKKIAVSAASLTATARNRYLETFSPAVVLDQLLAVYSSVAASRS